MQVKSLDITSFRNIESCNLKFSDSINVFYGKNGSGKTNLLEAIFVLLLARSPRRAGDSVMVKEAADFYRVEGEVHTDGKSDEIAVAFESGGRKRITISQVPARASELFENFCAVSTSPEDSALLAGPPAGRREFVNIYLSQASPRYIADLTDYQKALAQKNAFLKQENNSGETPYDDLMVKYGTAVMLARRNFLNAVRSSAGRNDRPLSRTASAPGSNGTKNPAVSPEPIIRATFSSSSSTAAWLLNGLKFSARFLAGSLWQYLESVLRTLGSSRTSSAWLLVITPPFVASILSCVPRLDVSYAFRSVFHRFHDV